MFMLVLTCVFMLGVLLIPPSISECGVSQIACIALCSCNTCFCIDNVPLQDALLQFVSNVLILDYPRLCKPLRTNIMVIKVSVFTHTIVDIACDDFLSIGSDSEEELKDV